MLKISPKPKPPKMSSDISKYDDNDVGDFYGIPDYHDFRIIYNDPVFSISVYRALSVANNTPVTIKIVNSQSEEDNLALEEEYRILTSMKQSLPVLKISKSFNSGNASYFKKNARLSFSADSDQALPKPDNRPFPTIIEKRRVYGMQCNMLIYDYLSSTTLTIFSPRNSSPRPNINQITGTGEDEIRAEDSTSSSFHHRPIPPSMSLEKIDQGRLSVGRLDKQKTGLRTSVARPASERRPSIEMQASIAAAEKSFSTISINSDKQRHKFRSLRIDQKLYIFFQVADALDIMHRLNICYLDISPENIFIKFVNNLHLPAAQLSKFDFAARSKTSGLNLNKRYMSPGTINFF
jgi:serine/threonine protein kinase